MREALRESLATGRPTYIPRGSIVICNVCGKPIYRVEVGIDAGERAGRAIRKFVPVTARDLATLIERPDVHAGTRAWLKAQSWAALMHYAEQIPRPLAGEVPICPKCGHCWCEYRTAEIGDTNDRAVVFEPHIIPPHTTAARLHRQAGDSPFLT